jgi:hypothetical protein
MNKANEIFLRLHEKTKRGEINWEETERETEFQAAFPAYSIRIGREEDQYALPVYYLKIFNQEGKLIEEVGEKDLSGSWESGQPTMGQLYELARRVAMRVEKALDSILSELGGKVEHGPKK